MYTRTYTLHMYARTIVQCTYVLLDKHKGGIVAPPARKQFYSVACRSTWNLSPSRPPLLSLVAHLSHRYTTSLRLNGMIYNGAQVGH